MRMNIGVGLTVAVVAGLNAQFIQDTDGIS